MSKPVVVNNSDSDTGCAIFVIGILALFLAEHLFEKWLDRAYPQKEPQKKEQKK